MGGQACVIKKKMCNPPALARLAIPEEIIASMGRGELDQSILEKAGLDAYLNRRSAIDEYAADLAKKADDWFYQNVYRIERIEKPLPAPWNAYELKPASDLERGEDSELAHDQDQDSSKDDPKGATTADLSARLSEIVSEFEQASGLELSSITFRRVSGRAVVTCAAKLPR